MSEYILTASTCSKHFLGKGAWSNVCHYIKGVTAECSWAISSNEMVLNEAIMKSVKRLNLFRRKQRCAQFPPVLVDKHSFANFECNHFPAWEAWEWVSSCDKCDFGGAVLEKRPHTRLLRCWVLSVQRKSLSDDHGVLFWWTWCVVGSENQCENFWLQVWRTYKLLIQGEEELPSTLWIQTQRRVL